MKDEIRTTMTVRNEEGLHARPAAQLVQAIRHLQCEVQLSRVEGEEINGKSILGVMMLAAERGTQLGVRASGPDAQKAIEAIAEILGDKPGGTP